MKNFIAWAFFILPNLGFCLSPPTAPATPSPVQNTPSSTPSPSFKQTAPQLPPPPVNNLPPQFRTSESYYRQPEEIPPSHTSMDAQEVLSLIEDQLAAIQMNDIGKAYHNYTATKFREATSLEEYKYFIDSFPVFSKNRNALFGNVEYKRDVATIRGSLSATNGEVLKVQYDFVKEGPQWKIIGIKLIRPEQSSTPQSGPLPVK